MEVRWDLAVRDWAVYDNLLILLMPPLHPWVAMFPDEVVNCTGTRMPLPHPLLLWMCHYL